MFSKLDNLCMHIYIHVSGQRSLTDKYTTNHFLHIKQNLADEKYEREHKSYILTLSCLFLFGDVYLP
jgi:hypothetical protein